jgi:hypothetical protein
LVGRLAVRYLDLARRHDADHVPEQRAVSRDVPADVGLQPHRAQEGGQGPDPVEGRYPSPSPSPSPILWKVLPTYLPHQYILL